ncbi:MAG: hypothetical protein H0T73_07030, partial [Ardenticatenales bacterium]|nr:hypothetical protein [Ardenticatenales bacterium]
MSHLFGGRCLIDEGPIWARGLTPEVLTGLESWGQEIRVEGDELSMTVTSEAQIPSINRYLV